MRFYAIHGTGAGVLAYYLAPSPARALSLYGADRGRSAHDYAIEIPRDEMAGTPLEALADDRQWREGLLAWASPELARA